MQNLLNLLLLHFMVSALKTNAFVPYFLSHSPEISFEPFQRVLCAQMRQFYCRLMTRRQTGIDTLFHNQLMTQAFFAVLFASLFLPSTHLSTSAVCSYFIHHSIIANHIFFSWPLYNRVTLTRSSYSGVKGHPQEKHAARDTCRKIAGENST